MSDKLLPKSVVLARVQKTFPTVWGWMREGRFPAAREVGDQPMWLESEINDWIAKLPVRKYKELASPFPSRNARKAWPGR
jgi:predicted DNA-binding transcriptional regulator AlpA